MIRLLIISLLLSSCSVNYHLNKAIKKGYRCDTESDTLTLVKIDSFPIIVNNSITWEKFTTKYDTIIRYKKSYVPTIRTVTKYRFDLKRFNDSLDHEVQKYRAELKNDFKIHKNDNPRKYLRQLIIVLICLTLCILAITKLIRP